MLFTLDLWIYSQFTANDGGQHFNLCHISFFNWLNSQKPNDELEKWIHQTIPAVKTVAPSHSTAKWRIIFRNKAHGLGLHEKRVVQVRDYPHKNFSKYFKMQGTGTLKKTLKTSQIFFISVYNTALKRWPQTPQSCQLCLKPKGKRAFFFWGEFKIKYAVMS